jgi:peptidoglycan/LPS O-acetylase OafA/YrhL
MGIIAVGIIILRVVRQGNLMYLGMHELGFLWLAIFYLALIFLALTSENPLVKGFFKMRALGGLGAISYGVYLIHQPVLWLFHILFGSGSPRLLTMKDLAITLLALVISLLVASLSWRFFESPFKPIEGINHPRLSETIRLTSGGLIPFSSGVDSGLQFVDAFLHAARVGGVGF